MGYSTTFDGHVTVDPPLNAAEIDYLKRFANSRRLKREQGPYYAEPGDDFGQTGEGIIDNNAPDGQPGLWCQWVPSDDGTAIVWDGQEKFYESAEWMAYLIEHFLKPGAAAFATSDPQFNEFSFNHVCNGTIEAQGEDSDDRWLLNVTDNEVTVAEGHIVYVSPSHEERDALAYDALLDIHRFLYPEEHKGYWHAQPAVEWPDGWDGESVHEWNAGTIEIVAAMVKRGLTIEVER